MEKSDIFIIALCISLMFLWFAKRTPPPFPQPSPPQETIDGGKSLETTGTPQSVQSGTLNTEHQAVLPQITKPSASVYHPDYVDLTPAPDIKLSKENEFELTINPQLGGISDIVLFQFQNTKDKPDPVTIGNLNHPIHAINSFDQSWKFSNAKIESQSAAHVSISRSIENTPLVLKQTWTINETNAYEIDIEVSLSNYGNDILPVDELSINCGIMNPLETASGFMGAGGIDQKIDVLKVDDDSPKTVNIQKVNDYDEKDHRKSKKWMLKWIAVQNKYFVSLLSAEEKFNGCKLTSEFVDPEKTNKKDPRNILGTTYLSSTSLPPQQSKEWNFQSFIGPKHYKLLKNQGQNKESVLQFDLFLFFNFKWMKGISLGILWGMNQLEKIFHNYGIAIIIITIIIRAIFWPITHKSTVWSKQMQKIQPLAQEIREKYKNDPQKMQQKTMELYREHKINPVAGCLPMLLQIPVFFALFNVFRSSIELRQASFLWAADLSRQDTIYTLPIGDIPLNPLALLMGLTMFLQQKTMPTSPDPMQQKVMMFMTIFFVIMLYPMPSGLTLYWTINQVISIIQYRITHNLTDKSA